MIRLLVSCTALCVLFAASAFAQSETQIGVTAGSFSSFAGSFAQGGGDVTAEMEYHFQVLKDAGDKISGIGALDKQ